MAARVLIISDRLEAGPGLIDAVRARAEDGPVTFRLIVTNPARAEFHLVHAERHHAVEQSQPALHRLLEELTVQAGSPLEGEISIRHDPFEAVEEDLLRRPAEEVLVAVHEHELAHRLHHDLTHRLKHLKVDVTVVPAALLAP